jgi:hypothetical protein
MVPTNCPHDRYIHALWNREDKFVGYSKKEKLEACFFKFLSLRIQEATHQGSDYPDILHGILTSYLRFWQNPKLGRKEQTLWLNKFVDITLRLGEGYGEIE